MKKLELTAMLTDSKKIIELVQSRGIVEIREISDERFVKIDTADCVTRFEQYREKAKRSLKILDEMTNYKPPLISVKHRYPTEDFFGNTQMLESTLRSCDEIIASARILDECKSEVSRLLLSIDELNGWAGLDISPSFKSTAMTTCFIGTVNGLKNKAEIESEIKSSAYFETVSQIGEQARIIVICLKSDRKSVESILKQGGFTPYEESDNSSIYEIKGKRQFEIKKFNEKISDREKRIASFSNERKNIEFVIDMLTVRCDKYKALGDLAMTENTFTLIGFIPEKYSQALISELESKFAVAVSLVEPDESDDVPVALENGRFASPVESVTQMYSLPGKKDPDPTGIMAFFYYLFFGMMLSDAGYGLVMVAVSLLAIKKLRLDRKLENTLKMFLYSGISTVFWGALFGSWFGDLPQTVASRFFSKEIGSLALWFEPLDDPIKLLLFSFALGIVHLFWGLAVRFAMLWKDGRKKDAVLDVIPIYMTVGGVAPAAAGILTSVPSGIKTSGMYIAFIGAVIIVSTAGRRTTNIIGRFFAGLYSLYNTATGYLSDILSYSRLLALGLATGSIASVINLIGTMPKNIALKAIMFIAVFILGHTANIAINLLGAYVHSNRLQFVELFSKFYEGGGRKFEPLKMNIELTEEK